MCLCNEIVHLQHFIGSNNNNKSFVFMFMPPSTSMLYSLQYWLLSFVYLICQCSPLKLTINSCKMDVRLLLQWYFLLKSSVFKVDWHEFFWHFHFLFPLCILYVWNCDITTTDAEIHIFRLKFHMNFAYSHLERERKKVYQIA